MIFIGFTVLGMGLGIAALGIKIIIDCFRD